MSSQENPSLIIAPHQGKFDENLAAEVFGQRPLLKELLDRHGGQSLNDYMVSALKMVEGASSKDSSQGSSPENGAQNFRCEELILTVKNLIEQRLGAKVAAEVATQMQKYYVASTADHHGPLGPSFGLNANLITATACVKIADPVLKYVPVFSCANISLSNEDFPRGLLFHSFTREVHTSAVSEANSFLGGKPELQKLSFLPSNSHSSVEYRFRPYLETEVAKVKKMVQEKMRAGLISSLQAQRLTQMLDSIFNRKDILESRDYCEQITKVNFLLWRLIFAQVDGFPDLIYLDQEEIVNQLLLNYHIDQESLIHRMIFDPELVTKLIEPLLKTMAPFLRQGFHGTDLFWGVSDDKNYRLALKREGNVLVSADGSFRLVLEKEAVRDALKKKILMPDLLMVYTVLHLYYGLNCFGGFNQIHYLNALQKVYRELQLDEVSLEPNSQLFHYGLRTLFYDLPGSTGSPQNPCEAVALDLFLNDHSNLLANVSTKFDQITFKSALEGFLPEVAAILGEK